MVPNEVELMMEWSAGTHDHRLAPRAGADVARAGVAGGMRRRHGTLFDDPPSLRVSLEVASALVAPHIVGVRQPVPAAVIPEQPAQGWALRPPRARRAVLRLRQGVVNHGVSRSVFIRSRGSLGHRAMQDERRVATLSSLTVDVDRRKAR